MNNKRNKISTIVLTAILVLSVFAAFVTPASAATRTYLTEITDDNTNFGSRDNEAVAFSVTSGLTLDELFAGDGLSYTYTIIAGGTYDGASPVIAVIDLQDGRHIALFPGWGERTDTYTLQFSETVAYDTGGNNFVDFALYPSDFSSWLYGSVSCSYGDFEAVKADTELISGSEVVTRIAIQHQAANTGETDRLESLTFGPGIVYLQSAYIGEKLPANLEDGTAVGVYYKYEHPDDEVYLGTTVVSDGKIPTKDILEDRPAGTYSFVVGDVHSDVTMSIATITLDVPSMVVKNDEATLTAKANVPNTQTSDGTQREVTFTIANEDNPNFPVKTADVSVLSGKATLELDKDDTNALVAGTYIVNAKFDKDTNDGLETKATATTFALQESAIQIEVDKTTSVVNQKIYVTVTTSLNANITIDTSPQTAKLEFVAGEGNPAPGDDVTTSYNVPDVGDDGIARVVVKFTDDGSYTLRATNEDTDDDDTVDVTIVKGKITVSAPTQAVIGETVEITGTATGTPNVNITIKDAAGEVIDTTVRSVSDNEYTYKWETESNMPATYKIYVYAGLEATGSADAAASIRLTEGDLVVNVPSVTAEADTGDMKVEGTATGADEVYMLVFRNANGNCEFNEIVSVKSDDWSFEETPLSDDATKGTYTVFVIHPGRDGELEDETVLAESTYSGKTIAQITSLIEYYTIDQPGSDDTLIPKEVTVEKDTVTILPIADIAAGATLTIDATTNRAEDNLATVTLTGPDGDIALVSTEVTDGMVTADFDTTDFATGVWDVEVDVDGTIETATVNVLATAPSPTVTPTVTPTATPTATPTVTPTVTPDQIPGFEAVFAIAGLLAVAYLVLRREE